MARFERSIEHQQRKSYVDNFAMLSELSEVPKDFIRSVHNAASETRWGTWVTECFIDEAARALRTDPIAIRIKFLEDNSIDLFRSKKAHSSYSVKAELLRKTATLANWGVKLPVNTGQGISCNFCRDNSSSSISCVARMAVDRDIGFVNVHKLFLMIAISGEISEDQKLFRERAKFAALGDIVKALPNLT